MDIINNDVKNKYPKILTPHFIKALVKKELLFEEYNPRVKRPTPPKRPIIKETANSELVVFLGFGFLALIAQFFLLFFISIFIGNNTIHPIVRTIVIAISVLIGAALAWSVRKNGEQEAVENQRHYEEKYKKYVDELNHYSLTKKEFQSPSSIIYKKRQMLKTMLSTIKKAILEQAEILDDNTVRRGLSEDFFYRYLKKYSQFQVYKSLKYKFYYPDLVLIKNNLVIDLEIDEPYSYEEKKPVHSDGQDEKRDNFLLNEGFVVIRFSEEQIIENPEICLEIINSVIDTYLNLTEMPINSKFKKVQKDVFQIENTFNLAYNNSRVSTALQIEKLIKKFDL